MKLRCINNEEHENKLTVGEFYQIRDEEDYLINKHTFVSVKDDSGKYSAYLSNRFEEVRDGVKVKIKDFYIKNRLFMGSNYIYDEEFLESADDCFMYIQDKCANTYELCFDDVVELRNYLTDIIEYTKSLGYKPRRELTQQEIESILGYKIKIVEGDK